MRSARASISQASDHIQSRGTSRAMTPLQWDRCYVWGAVVEFNGDVPLMLSGNGSGLCSLRFGGYSRRMHSLGKRAGEVGHRGDGLSCRLAVGPKTLTQRLDQRRADDDTVGAFGDGARMFGGANAE